ncbi:hypothetical protein A0J61_08977 [Choanephora cucurbitarum]|uniref:Uncharacterized protein n=1 Tax=Choanephora cucurbitarum TaxID=101091 RepID=A0A1C7N6M9_9FUNG|nr:hypothetical protein A0J61_08977 [Choanephora cucurbitarum]
MQLFSRITAILHCVRLISLVTAVSIVAGSLVFYSSSTLPLEITDDEQIDKRDSMIWTIQTITDRRLISTLVAAQASIFCPLFILLTTNNQGNIPSSGVSVIEMACQFLMPIGLALSWMFSILFDVVSTDLIGRTDICLIKEHCILFDFLYLLKYFIIVLFSIETSLVLLSFFVDQKSRQIQLPLESSNEKN